MWFYNIKSKQTDCSQLKFQKLVNKIKFYHNELIHKQQSKANYSLLINYINNNSSINNNNSIILLLQQNLN